MSIGSDIALHFTNNEVTNIVRTDFDFHGQRAVKVIAHLHDGRTVEGVFTTEPAVNFGGIEFSARKNIPALMIAKIESVLRGTYERS